ncbi:MAG: MvdC/MvdD family ATP grasp protein, partial [Acidobacteriota bacterium]
MIVILSQDQGDSTAEIVMDWIQALGGRCARLNGEDLTSTEPFSFSFSKEESSLRFKRSEGDLDASTVEVVWLRRWHRLENLGITDGTADEQLAHRVELHLRKELGATFGGLGSALSARSLLSLT